MFYTKMQRDRNVDFLKGVAIFLVVFGHAIQFLSGPDYMFLTHCTEKSIYLVHMPLFMFLSGYVSHSSLSASVKTFLTKKCKQLLLPAIVWSFIYLVCKMATGREEFCLSTLLTKYIYAIEGYWFVIALFSCFIFLRLVLYGNMLLGNRNKVELYLVITSVFVVLLLPHNSLFVHMCIIFVKPMYPFFCLGYLCNKHDVINRFVYNKKMLFLVCTVLYVMACFMATRDSFIYYLDLDFWNNRYIWKDYSRLLFFVTSAVCGIIILFNMSETLLKNIRTEYIVEIGKYSLGIYLLQRIVFERFANLVLGGGNSQYALEIYNCTYFDNMSI